MNIKKYLLIILFLLLPTINFAQKTSELDCENGFETIETEIESQEIVSYKIISSRKLYTEESFEFSEGIIVIADLNDQVSIKEIIKVIAGIGVKNKLSKILAFKTCKAVELYLQQLNLTSKQEDYLDKNLLPIVEIDLHKSLSKKERKRNKRKRDLIELVSRESCEEFKHLDIKKISVEQISQITSEISAQYVKKIEKVYAMSFEESTKEFLEDLANHSMFDCELMKEFAKELNEKPK